MSNNMDVSAIWNGIDSDKALKIFYRIADTRWNNISSTELGKLEKIFSFNVQHRDFFPKINGISCNYSYKNDEALTLYIEKWGDKFVFSSLPSERKGKKSASPYDQVVYLIIEYVSSFSEDEAGKLRRSHEGAMQAENIIGELLEEYIASVIEKYGWIWCKGPTMVATDFFYPLGDVCLQVKNKYNTENSSSSAIREGTDIKKWNRLTSKRLPGTDESKPNWDALNDIVFKDRNINPAIEDKLSEDGFRKFTKKVCENNPDIIVF